MTILQRNAEEFGTLSGQRGSCWSVGGVTWRASGVGLWITPLAMVVGLLATPVTGQLREPLCSCLDECSPHDILKATDPDQFDKITNIKKPDLVICASDVNVDDHCKDTYAKVFPGNANITIEEVSTVQQGIDKIFSVKRGQIV